MMLLPETPPRSFCLPEGQHVLQGNLFTCLVHAGTFSTARGKIQRCQNPLSPPSQLSHVLCAVSADGYPHHIRAPGNSQKLEYCANYSQDVQGAECPSLSRWLQPTKSYNHNIKYYYFLHAVFGKTCQTVVWFRRIRKVSSVGNNLFGRFGFGILLFFFFPFFFFFIITK